MGAEAGRSRSRLSCWHGRPRAQCIDLRRACRRLDGGPCLRLRLRPRSLRSPVRATAGAADRVDALLEEAGPAERVETVVHERQRRGEIIEGFGHPIYAPHSDPRGDLLVEIARELRGASPEVQSVLALVDAMEEGGFGGPSIDVGLVALSRALALPIGSATALFAIGRSVGWVAHALEQYEAGYLVRPRARYREA